MKIISLMALAFVVLVMSSTVVKTVSAASIKLPDNLNSGPTDVGGQPLGIGYDIAPKTTEKAILLITEIIKWAQYLFFFLAAIFGIWSAYDFLTSAGEEAKVKNARNRLVFALVAVAIALMAGGLPRIVQEIVQ